MVVVINADNRNIPKENARFLPVKHQKYSRLM
jgi:hypothetical protein